MGVLPVDDPCPWPVSSDAPSSLWQKSTDAPKEHRLKPVPPCVIKRLRSTVARTSVCVGFLPQAASQIVSLSAAARFLPRNLRGLLFRRLLGGGILRNRAARVSKRTRTGIKEDMKNKRSSEW